MSILACTLLIRLYSKNTFASSLVDVKKKALPLWIREGLEKLERKKQKQEQEDDNEPKKSTVNLSASGSSTIAGYDHGKVHSPIRSPKSNDSDEVQCTNKSLHLAQMGQIIRTNMQGQIYKHIFTPIRGYCVYYT